MGIFLIAKNYWRTKGLFFCYDIHDKQVEKWLLQHIVVGDILRDKPISSDDAVVFIQGITIPETQVHELNLTFMSDCLHKYSMA